jgi:hypothetical protein
MKIWHIFIDALQPWHLVVFAIVSFLFFYFIGKRDTHKR